MTLTEFLLARIAEDEKFGAWHPDWCRAVADDQACDCDGLARVLAECEAKRGAIDAAWADQERIEGEWGSSQSREQMSAKDDNPSVIEHLAAVYADHPDYREEWKP